MANAFDQFDQIQQPQQASNPFDQFDQAAPGLFSRIGNDWKQSAADFNNIGQNGESGIERAAQGVGIYGQALTAPIGEAIKSGITALNNNTAPDAPYKVIAGGINDAYQGSDLQGMAQGTKQLYDQGAQANPRLAADANAFLNMGNSLAMVKPGLDVMSGTAQTLGSGLKNAGRDIIDARKMTAAEKAVAPKLTPNQAIAQGVPERIDQGLFGSKIKPLPQEQAAAETLASLPGFKSGNTAVKNLQLATSSIEDEAGKLRGMLDSSGVEINPDEYKAGLLKLKDQIQNTKGISDATRSARAAPIDTMLQITDGAVTPSELLNARQELDRTFFNDKGVLPASAKKVYNDAIAPVRDYTNSFIGQSVPDAAVADSLAKQSALYTAKKSLAPKALKEAPTAIGRTIQNISNKIPIKDARVKMAAEVAGLGGIGAATYLAPAAVGLGVAGYAGAKALPYALKAAGFTLDNAGNLLKAGAPLTAGDIAKLSPAIAMQVLNLNQGNAQ